MKITLILVASVNGKTTRGNETNIYSWTSQEDKDFFFSVHKQHNLIVMGRKTYEAAKEIITPDPNKPRVILTKSPEKYAHLEVPGLEFSNETPAALVHRYERLGFTKMLLVAGSSVTTEFVTANLVTDMYVTLEPYLFGSGREIVEESDIAAGLELKEIKQLNTKGTVLLHYTFRPRV